MDLLRYGPGLGIGFAVIDRNLNIHVSGVFAVETLSDVQGIGCRLAQLIQPGLAIEPLGFDDQRIAFPPALRITQPGGIEVVGQFTAVEEDLPPNRMALIENHYQFRHLE